MRKKNWLLVALVLVLSSFLAACSGGSDSSGGDGGSGSGDSASGSANGEQVFNLTESTDIPSMDPQVSTDTAGSQWISETYEGLYRMKDGEISEGIAKGEPEVSEDALTWTFNLRDNAKWSNGEAVTAHDFVYGWQRAVDPETKSEYGPYMMGGVIKNAEAIATGEKDVSELGVKADGDYKLVVELEKPVPYFESLTAFTTFFPVNQKFVEEQGDKFALEADTMISNGPFKMTEWNHGSSFKFVKNEDYWDADTVQLEEINVEVVKDLATGVNLYDTGEIDRTPLSSEFVNQKINDPGFATYLEAGPWYLKLNQERNGEDTPLANINARKAIAQAIDKKGLVDVVLNNGSTEINGLIPAGFYSSEDGQDFREASGDYLTYDVDAAKESWEKAKEELGTEEVTVEILTGDTTTSTQMVDYFQEQLESNLEGLTVKTLKVPFQQRLELDTAEDYDIEVAGWNPDYVDPYTFLSLFETEGENNHMNYSSEAYDTAVERSVNENALDPEARWNDALEAEKILMEDAAIAPIYQDGRSYLISPKLQNVYKNQTGARWEYKWAYADNAAAENAQ
ncbi:peptide ABC transporter substrate-binding protein [Terribacillus halophilus]|uniref:peptide ABC transporter substrate-binding protein n=1 Tax=Terribacillus halophilus TaxID=361279 RepID=UPI000986F89C|nr:peptide ABC transporter substrate-binding protein [Terribacillus halophilus]